MFHLIGTKNKRTHFYEILFYFFPKLLYSCRKILLKILNADDDDENLRNLIPIATFVEMMMGDVNIEIGLLTIILGVQVKNSLGPVSSKFIQGHCLPKCLRKHGSSSRDFLEKNRGLVETDIRENR